MPTYDYECEGSNKHRFEALRPICDRDEVILCPVCCAKSKRVYVGTPVIPWAEWKTTSPLKS